MQDFKQKNRIITLSVIIVVISIMTLIPKSWLNSYEIPCFHEKLFGFQCPFCGMTSAVYNLVHFNFFRAIELNFVVIPLSILVFSEFILIFHQNKIIIKINKLLYLIVIISFISIYLIRIINFITK